MFRIHEDGHETRLGWMGQLHPRLRMAAVALPALVTLGLVAALLAALTAYEAVRFAERRAAVRRLAHGHE